jgi:hypothetical protein
MILTAHNPEKNTRTGIVNNRERVIIPDRQVLLHRPANCRALHARARYTREDER